jgi:spore coat polysaccharide biosynthesis protein SpsF
MKIVTKLRPLDDVPDDAPPREVRAAVDASVFRSCRDLRRQRLDILMFHRSADMFRWRGAALARLTELRSEGIIGALGTSVYAPAEAVDCLADERITCLQLPFNLLDARWLSGAFPAALAARKDVQIHVRSVFLQGVLVSEAGLWPQCGEFAARIEDLSRKLGRKGRADLCIAYVRSFPWVTTLVLGAETLRQLEELAALATEPALTQDETREVQATFPHVPERLLNPAQWNA